MHKKKITWLISLILLMAIIPFVSSGFGYDSKKEVFGYDSKILKGEFIYNINNTYIGNDSLWSQSGSDIYYSSGNIGIGISNPQSKLHIQGGSFLVNGSTGSISDEGKGTKLMWTPSKASFRAGYVNGNRWNSSSTGYSSVAFGYDTIAGGYSSVAFGYGTRSLGFTSLTSGTYSQAYGDNSLAFGQGSRAYGDNSIAFSESSQAEQYGSVVMGYGSLANGSFSTVFGYNTKTTSYANTVIGRYNVGGGTDSWSDPEPIFEVGIGTSPSNTENAMTILKNGYVGIGTVNPGVPLQVNGTVNGISISAEGNISATDYLIHSYVWDKDKDGKALDKIKDSSELVNPDGTINHKAKQEIYIREDKVVYHLVGYNYHNETRCLNDNLEEKLPEELNKCKTKQIVEPIYEEEIVSIDSWSLGKWIAEHEQTLYELKEENIKLKSDMEELKLKIK